MGFSRHQMRHPRLAYAAVLMLGLHFAVQLLAHSDALHHCLHEDSHEAEHQCVIKGIADGHMLAGPAQPIESHPAAFSEFLPEMRSVELPAERGVRPPGRAPPASLT